MTNVIFLNTFFPFAKKQNNDFEAKIFIEVARKAFENAESQMFYGEITKTAILESGQENLLPIANWHFQKGAEQFQEAINNLEQAKRLTVSAKHLKYIDLKMKKCLEKLQFITITQGNLLPK